MSVGRVGPFDLTKDSWDLYIERLEQYFIANDVKEAVKVATLITVIGSDTYELMVNLCLPARPTSKTFSELVTIMQSHLQPKPSILAERYKFRQRRQRTGEGIAEYVAELKKLSKHCGFDAVAIKENLRDQFVCGLLSDSIRQRLFAESNVTFDMAFKIAVTLETAETDAAEVEWRSMGPGQSSSSTSVHQVSFESNRHGRFKSRGQRNQDKVKDMVHRGVSARAQSSRGSGPLRNATPAAAAGREQYGGGGGGERAGVCSACGGLHSVSTCKYRVFVCRICMREGHLAKMCQKLREVSSTVLHNNVEEVVYQSDCSDEVLNFSFRTNFKHFSPLVIDVRINNVNLSMEIDTGSAISCISYDCYLQMFKNVKLSQCNLIIKYYTGETVKPIGKFNPTVCYGSVTKCLDLFVIDKGKTSLLGRQWLHVLGINWPVTQCNKVEVADTTFNLARFSSRFCEVFKDGLGRSTGGTVGFHLRPGARPVFMRARPLAYALREPVERALDDLVRDGVITPVDTSDWATPIVPVMKKDGNIRVCGDFKITLNKSLEVDRFPLPRVEDLLTKLHGGQKFTKLDFSQAYAQLELDESKKYAVINTHRGLFRYNRLIYGLASSPAIFQKKIEQLFGDMPRVGIFLDDVIITGRNDEEHINTLTEVFERLQKYGLRIKKEKCSFFTDSVTYLGFVISKDGVHTCKKKIEAIKNAAIPKNVTELRAFLGLVMYYAKFVPNISTILSSLYDLLRKDVKFEWTSERDRAFNEVKRLLISSEVLAHYSPELPLVLTTDASSVGVGAVISHLMPAPASAAAAGREEATSERPIAFASRILNNAERGYSQIEKEALSIIFGIKKFHQYLYGRKFILKTDHKPLVSIFGDKAGIPVMAASRLQRWAVLLSGYDYDIQYVRSNQNAADALSRLPVGIEKAQSNELTYVNFIQNFLPITRSTVHEHLKKNTTFNKIIYYLQNGWPTDNKDETLQPFYTRRNELYLDQGCIIWGYRLVIPDLLRADLLKELHIGHMGIVKMKSIARSYMWWPGIDRDIEQTCRECSTCVAEGSAPPRAPPQPWPYVAEPWSRLHVDFLGPFHGKMFFVLIDASTKWLEIFPMQRTTATALIKVLREIFARFGLPLEVVSDNGPPFSSKEYVDFLEKNGIKVTYSAIYHPASNGAAEAAVKLCKRALKKALRDGQEVDAALQTYLMAYRNVEHSTTGVAPAKLLQNRKLRSRLDLLKGDRQVNDRVTQNQEKQVKNSGGVDRHFQVGDSVWARNYGGGNKWISGRIEGRLGSRNYVIARENDSSIKRHIDQIRNKWNNIDIPNPVTESLESEVQRPNPPTVESTIPHKVSTSPPRANEPCIASGSGAGAPEGRQGSEVEPGPSREEAGPNSGPPVDRVRRERKVVKRFGIEID